MKSDVNGRIKKSSTDRSHSLLWLGPLLSVVVAWLALEFGGLTAPASMTLGVAIWTALWWIFETVPIPVASLIPLALLPMLGILSPQTVGEKYGHPLVLLLLGGFLLSKAMEKSGADTSTMRGLANCPEFFKSYFQFYGPARQGHSLSEALIEMVRLRIARHNDCFT